MKTRKLTLVSILLLLVCIFSSSCEKIAKAQEWDLKREMKLKVQPSSAGYFEWTSENTVNFDQLLKENGVSWDNVNNTETTVESIKINNGSNKDTIFWDDLDSLNIDVLNPKMSSYSGLPLLVQLALKHPEWFNVDVIWFTSGENAVQPAALAALKNVNPKTATFSNGDPIRLGDVKLGMKGKLLKDIKEPIEIVIALNTKVKASLKK